MPLSPAYRPEPLFAALGPEFSDPVDPAAFPKQVLRYRNRRAAATVGLDELTDAEWLSHFASFQSLPGQPEKPLAMRYHGHQFGNYNPEIGDGRGFLFAQLREAGSSRLLDLATKGSGKTPYSRFGDGRLTLKGGVREVLAASMLEARGVPTSRAFSLVETGEALQRNDEPSPTRSSVLVRLSHSHVRFGTFQRHTYFERNDLIEQLAAHALETYFPELSGAPDKAVALLAGAVGASARLAGRWMAAGFVQGVLNTDNMVVTGESFDYGPWRFLPAYDPAFTAAYFDETGRYAYGRQSDVVFWNLQQLAACLLGIADSEPLIAVLNKYGAAYHEGLREAVMMRLGLKRTAAEDETALVRAVFAALAEGGAMLGFEPLFFDWFGGLASKSRALAGPRAALYDRPAFMALRDLFSSFEMERPERLDASYFAGQEPQDMLIDEVEAIWAPIAADDDWSRFEAKLAAVEAARAAMA
ncbi:MAG: hypothetical protein JWM33_2258 [Caulobacteraceae bacterium]|nr:hypothetical protein [Caulobacteraceae bacterium]